MTDQGVTPGIFRAYDIRGIVPDTLNETVAEQIGLAVGSEAKEQGVERIAVGRDGRASSPGLAQAVIKGLNATGCDVTDVGECPSPGLYFAAKQLAGGSGVMITGSHNPTQYNGIKVMLNHTTLSEQAITGLYDRIAQQDFVAGAKAGHCKQQDIFPQYLEAFTQNIQLDRPLNVVVDCGNGVAGHWVPKLFNALGCVVTPLFCEVDGTFPNHHPNPSEPENLQDLIGAVTAHQADIGFAFDGDGDRVGVVTNHGTIVWPDRFMMIIVKALLRENPGASIPFDVKCSDVLPEVITQYGGVPVMSRTGHSLLKTAMEILQSPFAGEMSGHLFFADRWYGTDDGAYAAARLCEILSRSSQDAETLFAQFPSRVSTPELHVPLTDETKFAFMDELMRGAKSAFSDATDIVTIDGLRVAFEGGWGLVRASNTTPVLTVRFEAKDEDTLGAIQARFRTVLLDLNPELELPF